MKTPWVIINDHKKILEVYEQTEQYLKTHNDLHEEIANHLWAYYEMLDLVPQTLKNVGSGHFFPYLESHHDLENSFEFCKQGFYRHSFFALRCALELAVVGLYFDKDNQGHIAVQRWIRSKDPTPDFRTILRCLYKLKYFHQFDDKFGLKQKVEDIYSLLNNYVHVRGFRYSSRGQRLANFNQFSEPSLHQYVKVMRKVVKSIVTMMFLKYPIGVQSLPLWEKFGFNSPMGGFLNDLTRRVALSILDKETRQVLQTISDNDPTVEEIVREIVAMPDLTRKQLDKQRVKVHKMMRKARTKKGAKVRPAIIVKDV